MITLPDFKKAFDYENSFYLSCNNSRLGKFVIHYELFKMVQNIPGALIECGVFKGTSLARFAGFRQLIGNSSKKIIGFDTFAQFPETNFAGDKKMRRKLIAAAGNQSISIAQLKKILRHKEVDEQIELVSGDITQTIPAYVKKHPKLKISLLNVDVDIYEPSVTILKYLYPLVVPGGIVILDDYGVFPGETKAVDDYFKGRMPQIQKFHFSKTPVFIVKK